MFQSFADRDPEVTKSRIYFVEIPGTEALMKDAQGARRLKEHSLIRSLTHYEQVCRSLSSHSMDVDFAHFDQSKLTQILQDALGGNAYGVAIGLGMKGKGDEANETIRILDYLSRVHQFPIPMNSSAQGLVRRFQRVLHEQLLDPTIGDEARTRTKRMNCNLCATRSRR